MIRSPSTRRAWIEILLLSLLPLSLLVALHPEGVDRNRCVFFIALKDLMSPSTRRAWIEIYDHAERWRIR